MPCYYYATSKNLTRSKNAQTNKKYNYQTERSVTNPFIKHSKCAVQILINTDVGKIVQSKSILSEEKKPLRYQLNKANRMMMAQTKQVIKTTSKTISSKERIHLSLTLRANAKFYERSCRFGKFNVPLLIYISKLYGMCNGNRYVNRRPYLLLLGPTRLNSLIGKMNTHMSRKFYVCKDLKEYQLHIIFLHL